MTRPSSCFVLLEASCSDGSRPALGYQSMACAEQCKALSNLGVLKRCRAHHQISQNQKMLEKHSHPEKMLNQTSRGIVSWHCCIDGAAGAAKPCALVGLPLDSRADQCQPLRLWQPGNLCEPLPLNGRGGKPPAQNRCWNQILAGCWYYPASAA